MLTRVQCGVGPTLSWRVDRPLQQLPDAPLHGFQYTLVRRLSLEAGLSRELREEYVCVRLDHLDLPSRQQHRPDLVKEANRECLSCPLFSLASILREQVSYTLISEAIAHKNYGVVSK